MATNQVQEETAAQQRMMDTASEGGGFPADENDPFVNPMEPKDEGEYRPQPEGTEPGVYVPGQAPAAPPTEVQDRMDPRAFVADAPTRRQGADEQDNQARSEAAVPSPAAAAVVEADPEPGTYVPGAAPIRSDVQVVKNQPPWEDQEEENPANAMLREAEANAAAAEAEEEERRRREQERLEAEQREREEAEARRQAGQEDNTGMPPAPTRRRALATKEPNWLQLTEEEHDALVLAHPTGFTALDKIDLRTTLDAMNENLRGGGLTWRNLSRITVAPGGVEIFRQTGSSNPTTLTEVTGIVVWWDYQRGYWEEELDENGNVVQQGRTPPTCSSGDNVIGIGTPGGKCRTCDLNKYGTAHNGRGKACKEKRLMYVLQPGKLLPTILQAPSASIESMTEYLVSLVDCEDPKKYWEVVTQFNLDRIDPKDGQPYTVIKPRNLGHLPKRRLPEIKSYVDNIRPHLESMYEAMTQDE